MFYLKVKVLRDIQLYTSLHVAHRYMFTTISCWKKPLKLGQIFNMDHFPKIINRTYYYFNQRTIIDLRQSSEYISASITKTNFYRKERYGRDYVPVFNSIRADCWKSFSNDSVLKYPRIQAYQNQSLDIINGFPFVTC